MRHAPSRVLAVRERPRILAAAARLAMFLAVEAIARACGLRLDRAFQGLGVAGQALGATVVMAWAFEAHRRYTFRDRRTGEALEGAMRFVVASWACLVLEAAALRFTPLDAPVAWLAVSLAKFAFVCRWTWTRSRPPLEAHAA